MSRKTRSTPTFVASQSLSIMMESQAVISLRMLGMMGILPVDNSEQTRMIQEKQKALVQSTLAMTTAALTGQPALKIWAAGLTPYRRATRSNLRRLGGKQIDHGAS